MSAMKNKKIICGVCGATMIMRELAPCIDCGGNPRELDEMKSGHHYYTKYELFDDNVLCDFCAVDMPSRAPLFWGFPADFDWDKAFEQHSFERVTQPKCRIEMACSKCYNTLRKQEFVRKNVKRNGVTLPKGYWPYLED